MGTYINYQNFYQVVLHIISCNLSNFVQELGGKLRQLTDARQQETDKVHNEVCMSVESSIRKR